MNKKGITARTIMIMVIILIVGVLLIIFFQKWYETASYEAHKRQCEQSVRLHVASVKIGERSEIKCPVWFETLSGSDESIKKRIADLMADAWSVFGEGRYELFGEEKTYCSIYAVVDFKDKNKKIIGLNDYLIDKTIPIKGISYMAYLGGYETSKAKTLVKNIEEIKKYKSEDVMDGSKDYAVIFIYAKGEDFIRDTIDSIGSIKVSIGGGIISGVVGGTVAIFAFGTNPFGWTTVGIITVSALFSAKEIYFTEGKVGWYSTVLFRPYEKEEIQKIGCQEFPVKTVK